MIFTPFLVTFIWCNSVLAKEIWKHQVDVKVTDEKNETGTAGNVISRISERRIERKRRQIRMFKVILILMGVFLFCRLPTWIYLLYKLKHPSDNEIHHILYFVFGLMVMANCMMNPFLYTFLRDTIRLTTFLSGIIFGIFSPCSKLLRFKSKESGKVSYDLHRSNSYCDM